MKHGSQKRKQKFLIIWAIKTRKRKTIMYTVILVSKDRQTLQLSTPAKTSPDATKYALNWLENNPEYSMYEYSIVEVKRT